MGRKDSTDFKRRTKKNSAIEKKKRNGKYGEKHIRSLEQIKNKRDKK